MTTVSIITPSFNQGQFIERTIQSVLAQEKEEVEYLVVDGGSSDETVDILKKYSSQLRWLSEKDNGQTDAVNKGIQLTSGEIIGWLNSDDVYYPGAIKKIIHFFETHPQVDVVYGDANHIDAEDAFLERYYTEEWNIERLKQICYLCQPAVFFRRSVIARFGLLNDRLQYCMDYEYWLRLALQGAVFAYFPELLAGSRLHADTKTLGSRVKVHQEINDMLRQLLGRVPDRWLSNYAYAVVESKLKCPARLFRWAVCWQKFVAGVKWNGGLRREKRVSNFNHPL